MSKLKLEKRIQQDKAFLVYDAVRLYVRGR